MPWYIPFLALYALFFFSGMIVNVAAEHKFHQILGKERIKELAYNGVIKVLLLNPWWIFAYAVFMPIMGFGALALGWKASLQVVIQGAIVAAKSGGITKADVRKLEEALGVEFKMPEST